MTRVSTPTDLLLFLFLAALMVGPSWQREVHDAETVMQNVQNRYHILYLFRAEADQATCTQSWRGLPGVRTVVSRQCHRSPVGCALADGGILKLGPFSRPGPVECSRYQFQRSGSGHDAHLPDAGTLWIEPFEGSGKMPCGVQNTFAHTFGCDGYMAASLAPHFALATQGTPAVWKSSPQGSFMRTWTVFKNEDNE
ncbi:MAG: hypothetical protein M1826_007027 [Phylliscum demangeonii]|nr:MAG: hypothetical protein M1826_007027 [Phylliscum demangeonii]